MARMSPAQLDDFLAGDDHRGTAILAVARAGAGPMLVPLSFRFEERKFLFATKPGRRHARAFEAAGRASVIVHHEDYAPGCQVERYVVGEGPIAWVGERPPEDEFGTAVLTAERLVGVIYEFG